MKFHPLADLFPLMEGAEFDELAASIKANGLREEITLLDNSILDGRNRYRACEKAGVKPRFEEFTGDDPYAFVADKNIHRRHLNESQLGLIGARMATLKRGGDRSNVAIGTLPLSAEQIAKTLGISRHTIQRGKVVLAEGSPEEIKAVEQGNASVGTLFDKIKNRRPHDRRNSQKGQSVARTAAVNDHINTQRRNAQIWRGLSDALIALTSLPKPIDVVRVARGNVKQVNVVDERLFKSLQWLKDFSHEWSKRNETAGQELGTDHRSDAGTGN